MWPAVRNIIQKCSLQSQMQQVTNVMNQQIRTTFILKRKFDPQLHRRGMRPKTLRSKHYIYELVKDSNMEKQQLLKLILTSNVEGLGNMGDLVEVKPIYGYNYLLMLKKAVYASEKNIERYANLGDDIDRPSSPYVPLSMQGLSRMTLSVIMNLEVPWTLKPWHIKVSFRKCGWEVPEKAITIPYEPIQGPNMDLENKEFVVTVEFSPKERQEVKCRIHHWSTNPSDRLPYVKEFWKIPTESIFLASENTVKS